MGKHIWRVIECKNPKCRCVNPLIYYGANEGQLEIGEVFKAGFLWKCSQCQQTFRYEKEEAPIKLLDFAPPSEWETAFGPGYDLRRPIDSTKIH